MEEIKNKISEVFDVTKSWIIDHLILLLILFFILALLYFRWTLMYFIYSIPVIESVKIGLAIVAIIVTLFVLVIQLRRNRKMQAEGTFFNLLNSIRSMVSTTEGYVGSKKYLQNNNPNFGVHIPQKKSKGVNYFHQAYSELNNRLKDTYIIITYKSPEFNIEQFAPKGLIIDFEKKTYLTNEDYEAVKKIYNDFFDDHSAELAHYYRFTYNVLNYVDENKDISKSKKREYINFIQSQMSDSELQLLYFNGIGRHGKKYYDLIEKYNFLENIDTSGNKDFINSLENFYPKSTFRL